MCHHAAEVWESRLSGARFRGILAHSDCSTCSSSQPMVHSADTGMAGNGSSPQSAFSTSAFCAAELQLQQAKTSSAKDSVRICGCLLTDVVQQRLIKGQFWLLGLAATGSMLSWQPVTRAGRRPQRAASAGRRCGGCWLRRVCWRRCVAAAAGARQCHLPVAMAPESARCLVVSMLLHWTAVTTATVA
jgi:hypothetical protein